MRTAIYGAGSLGTVMGALMSRNGGEVVLVDSNREHVKALNERGATVTGKLELNVPVRAITPDEMTGIYDLVFLIVKQTANDLALKQLLPHLGTGGIVCTLQNGVPEETVAGIVGADRTLGAIVNWGATWVEPGVSMLTSEFNQMTYGLGEIDGTIRRRTHEVAQVLNLAGHAEIEENLAGTRWTKLAINASFSGMSAVLGCTFGDILDNRKALICASHIVNELVQVCSSRGIVFPVMYGSDLGMLAFNNPEEMCSKLPVYPILLGPHRLLKASMLQDLEKNLKTEIDYINGAVSSWGRSVNVPAPVNDKVVEIVKGIEDKKYVSSINNISLFDIPGVF